MSILIKYWHHVGNIYNAKSVTAGLACLDKGTVMVECA